MLKQILGGNPRTTLLGALMAGLVTLQGALTNGGLSLTEISLAVIIAIFGRIAGDSNNTN